MPIVKLSGRGLGFTGGTIDKLESIPNFNCALPMDKIIAQVKEIGGAIASQTAKLAPADGKLYALRDVTATVDSMPLIASSVVSKKIASGANIIILDVKYGSGAFMKTPQMATELSELMVEVGKRLGKKIVAVVSSMDEPLGKAVGNSLEVIETIEFLKGNTCSDLAEITYKIVALALLKLGIVSDEIEAMAKIKEVVSSGKALLAFKTLVEKQCGDIAIIDNYDVFPSSINSIEVKSTIAGYVESIDALCVAKASKLLGAGREKKSDIIDYSAGVFLNKKTGDVVNAGDIIATVYANELKNIDLAQELISSAFTISAKAPETKSLIYKVID